MLNRVKRFFASYKHFGLVIIAIIISLILDITGKDTFAHLILGITALLSSVPLLKGMLEDLRSGKYGIDILAATAIITSVILHEYWAGIIIVLMLTGGESLEDYAERRARIELDSLLSRAPKQAHVLRGRKVVDVDIKLVKVGDKLVIKAGEVVPVDAVILEGESDFDESSLTGESLPLEKSKGDNIMSGSLVLEGTVTARAIHTAADSQYEQIVELVKNAAGAESPFVRLTDRYAIPFTIVSFIIAGTAWVMSGDPVRFLQVIVVATPCPLLLAAPIALISGMSRAAKHGIIIKTGSALEKLAEVRTVAFDKTGTLTHGTPTVDDVIAYHSYNADDILQYSAALEQNSTHVLASAITAAAIKKGLKLPKAKQLHELPGHGISGMVGSKHITVGRLKHLLDRDIEIPESFKQSDFKTTATFVAINGSLAGAITFVDRVRGGSESMLKRLKALGIKNTLMVTGDSRSAAEAIARQLHISDVMSDALPGDKVRAIEDLQPRPVAFVGDGVNDAPVLTASDVGIALGARGSTAASESADVVIMLDDVAHVAQAVEIAQTTFKIAKQAILIGIGMSIIMQFVFFTGKFKAVLGAGLQEVVDVTVIFIALRAHGSFYSPKKRSTKK